LETLEYHWYYWNTLVETVIPGETYFKNVDEVDVKSSYHWNTLGNNTGLG
jgi:hypothetical protein